MAEEQQRAAEAPGVAVEFDRVSLSFEKNIVLSEVSFRLERGENKIILGVTGSGKSVLLKLTMGLLKPDAGRITVLGEEITGMTEEQMFAVRQKIGMVFQESALFDSVTVGENVGTVFERLTNVPPEEAERRVREALRFVEMEQTFDLMPSELSGGMRRRVAIARAVVGQPQLMLYDSPTAGLDPITSARIMTLIVKQRDVSAVSSLLVTHRIRDAYIMALTYYDPRQEKLLPAVQNGSRRDTNTTFLVLRDGNVQFQGTLEEMQTQRDPYVRRFLA
ncbi:MAG: ATP-binding cassette domain-containing protein [Acidobacteria bacterium]|nr:ATP-binding cassette domain-containing protein [Acidobacteriota bacterium]